MKNIATAFCIILLPVLLRSQTLNTDNFSSFGVFTDYSYISNTADFKNLPGNFDCCPRYSSSTGSGYSIGGRYTYTFSDFGIELRSGINHGEGNFFSTQSGQIAFDPYSQKSILNVNDEYYLSYSYTNLVLEAHGFYYIIDRLSISLGAGSLFFFNSSYNQHEEIAAPSGYKQSEGSSEEVVAKLIGNYRNGNLPNLNAVQFYAGARIGYELPITSDHAWVLKPEFSFDLNFNDMIQDTKWNTSKLNLGFSVFYTLGKTVVPSEETVKKLQKELERKDEENKKLKMENEKAVAALQGKLDSETSQKQNLAKVLTEKEAILKRDSIKKADESAKLKQDRDEENRRIDAENEDALKGCSCYVILYSSSVDKEKADNVLSVLKKNEIDDAKIIIFNDPYLKTRFYRVQSKCYEDFNEAFNELSKIKNNAEISNIGAQVKCGR